MGGFTHPEYFFTMLFAADSAAYKGGKACGKRQQKVIEFLEGKSFGDGRNESHHEGAFPLTVNQKAG